MSLSATNLEFLFPNEGRRKLLVEMATQIATGQSFREDSAPLDVALDAVVIAEEILDLVKKRTL